VLKPDYENPEENLSYIQRELSRRLQVFAQQRQLRRLLRGKRATIRSREVSRRQPEEATARILQQTKAKVKRAEKSIAVFGFNKQGECILFENIDDKFKIKKKLTKNLIRYDKILFILLRAAPR